MESARRAESADLSIVRALYDHAVAEKQDQRGGPVWSQREARRGGSGSIVIDEADGRSALWVGEYAGAIVGFAGVEAEELADGRLLGVVHELYVLPDAREVGVGEMMMDAIVAWCSVKGCIGVDALALPGDRATKNFFETFGLVARAIVVHRSLLPAPHLVIPDLT